MVVDKLWIDEEWRGVREDAPDGSRHWISGLNQVSNTVASLKGGAWAQLLPATGAGGPVRLAVRVPSCPLRVREIRGALLDGHRARGIVCSVDGLILAIHGEHRALLIVTTAALLGASDDVVHQSLLLEDTPRSGSAVVWSPRLMGELALVLKNGRLCVYRIDTEHRAAHQPVLITTWIGSTPARSLDYDFNGESMILGLDNGSIACIQKGNNDPHAILPASVFDEYLEGASIEFVHGQFDKNTVLIAAKPDHESFRLIQIEWKQSTNEEPSLIREIDAFCDVASPLSEMRMISIPEWKIALVSTTSCHEAPLLIRSSESLDIVEFQSSDDDMCEVLECEDELHATHHPLGCAFDRLNHIFALTDDTLCLYTYRILTSSPLQSIVRPLTLERAGDLPDSALNTVSPPPPSSSLSTKHKKTNNVELIPKKNAPKTVENAKKKSPKKSAKSLLSTNQKSTYLSSSLRLESNDKEGSIARQFKIELASQEQMHLGLWNLRDEVMMKINETCSTICGEWYPSTLLSRIQSLINDSNSLSSSLFNESRQLANEVESSRNRIRNVQKQNWKRNDDDASNDLEINDDHGHNYEMNMISQQIQQLILRIHEIRAWIDAKDVSASSRPLHLLYTTINQHTAAIERYRDTIHHLTADFTTIQLNARPKLIKSIDRTIEEQAQLSISNHSWKMIATNDDNDDCRFISNNTSLHRIAVEALCDAKRLRDKRRLQLIESSSQLNDNDYDDSIWELDIDSMMMVDDDGGDDNRTVARELVTCDGLHDQQRQSSMCDDDNDIFTSILSSPWNDDDDDDDEQANGDVDDNECVGEREENGDDFESFTLLMGDGATSPHKTNVSHHHHQLHPTSTIESTTRSESIESSSSHLNIAITDELHTNRDDDAIDDSNDLYIDNDDDDDAVVSIHNGIKDELIHGVVDDDTKECDNNRRFDNDLIVEQQNIDETLIESASPDNDDDDDDELISGDHIDNAADAHVNNDIESADIEVEHIEDDNDSIVIDENDDDKNERIGTKTETFESSKNVSQSIFGTSMSGGLFGSSFIRLGGGDNDNDNAIPIFGDDASRIANSFQMQNNIHQNENNDDNVPLITSSSSPLHQNNNDTETRNTNESVFSFGSLGLSFESKQNENDKNTLQSSQNETTSTTTKAGAEASTFSSFGFSSTQISQEAPVFGGTTFGGFGFGNSPNNNYNNNDNAFRMSSNARSPNESLNVSMESLPPQATASAISNHSNMAFGSNYSLSSTHSTAPSSSSYNDNVFTAPRAVFGSSSSFGAFHNHHSTPQFNGNTMKSNGTHIFGQSNQQQNVRSFGNASASSSSTSNFASFQQPFQQEQQQFAFGDVRVSRDNEFDDGDNDD